MIHAATLERPTHQERDGATRSHASIFDQRKTLLENVEDRRAEAAPQLSGQRGWHSGAHHRLCAGAGTVRAEPSTHPDQSPTGSSSFAPCCTLVRKASLTQLLTLFLEKAGDRLPGGQCQGGLITGWITMDDVMKVLMGARV